MENLLINHPFIGGNKQIGFTAADTFLLMNRYNDGEPHTYGGAFDVLPDTQGSLNDDEVLQL